MKNCFIKIRSGDEIVDVTVRLGQYAIIPREEYERLIVISEKVAIET